MRWAFEQRNWHNAKRFCMLNERIFVANSMMFRSLFNGKYFNYILKAENWKQTNRHNVLHRLAIVQVPGRRQPRFRCLLLWKMDICISFNLINLNAECTSLDFLLLCVCVCVLLLILNKLNTIVKMENSSKETVTGWHSNWVFHYILCTFNAMTFIFV